MYFAFKINYNTTELTNTIALFNGKVENALGRYTVSERRAIHRRGRRLSGNKRIKGSF